MRRADALIGSSTSGLLPTDLQAEMRHPERLVVAHPFNPVYLLPLVEIVGGQKTVARDDRARQELLCRDRHEAAACAQGDRRLHRRPAARGVLARGAVAGARRRRDGGGDRRRRPLFLRPALGADGHVHGLPHRRRRAGHAALHEPVRPGAEMAVDQAHGRAGVQRRRWSTRSSRNPTRRRATFPSASWSASATTTSSPSCRRCAPRTAARAGAPARC